MPNLLGDAAVPTPELSCRADVNWPSPLPVDASKVVTNKRLVLDEP